MKEKIKVGDIVKYKGMSLFDNVKIIGYVIGTSVTNTDVPIGYYRIIVLKDNKKSSLTIGKVVCVGGYYGSLIKLY